MSPFQIWLRDNFHEHFREDSKVYLIESLARVAAEAAVLLLPPRPSLPDGVAEGRTLKAACS